MVLNTNEKILKIQEHVERAQVLSRKDPANALRRLLQAQYWLVQATLDLAGRSTEDGTVLDSI